MFFRTRWANGLIFFSGATSDIFLGWLHANGDSHPPDAPCWASDARLLRSALALDLEDLA